MIEVRAKLYNPHLEHPVRYSLALSCAAVSALALSSSETQLSKPCDGTTDVPALEGMLPLARVALRIPGTDQVAVDASGRCIGIQVRTHGTARLVKLLLRGVNIPREAVDLRVVETAPPQGA